MFFYFSEILFFLWYYVLQGTVKIIIFALENINKMTEGFIENISSQMRKGYLEYCVLLLINKKPCYSSDLIVELKKVKLIVVEGTLYPLLSRLKNNGILSYRWEESTQGPPRKYYEITDYGKIVLNEIEKTWTNISQVIENIKNTEI